MMKNEAGSKEGREGGRGPYLLAVGGEGEVHRLPERLGSVG